MDLTALHEGPRRRRSASPRCRALRPIKDHEQTAIGAEARAVVMATVYLGSRARMRVAMLNLDAHWTSYTLAFGEGGRPSCVSTHVRFQEARCSALPAPTVRTSQNRRLHEGRMEEQRTRPGFPISLWYRMARINRRALISGVPTQGTPPRRVTPCG